MNAASPPASTDLVGRWTSCRLVNAADYPYLYELLAGPAETHRWRFRGATPDPASFDRLLWSGVLAQFIVESRSTGQPLGLVCAMDPANDMAHVSLGVVFDPAVRGRRWPTEGIYLFVRYLFDHFPLRKLYAHIPEYNFEPLRGLERKGMAIEGCLRGHIYFDGRLWDELILALHREVWESTAFGSPRKSDTPR